jgi:alkylhydroperoxidase family enzyme
MPRIEPIPWEDLTAAQRERIEAGVATGAFTDILPLRILAYAEHETAPDDGDRHPNFPRHLLGGRLLELLRIRSAQLGGCAPCMTSRKNEGATEVVVACLANPGLSDELSPRERLALEYLELLATDHHRIDGETYRRLAEHFTTAEIVELGATCGPMIGMHRFMHTLDIFGDASPVVGYDPDQVGVTWDELQGPPARRTAAAG